MCGLYTRVFGRQIENSEITQVNLDRIKDRIAKEELMRLCYTLSVAVVLRVVGRDMGTALAVVFLTGAFASAAIISDINANAGWTRRRCRFRGLLRETLACGTNPVS